MTTVLSPMSATTALSPMTTALSPAMSATTTVDFRDHGAFIDVCNHCVFADDPGTNSPMSATTHGSRLPYYYYYGAFADVCNQGASFDFRNQGAFAGVWNHGAFADFHNRGALCWRCGPSKATRGPAKRGILSSPSEKEEGPTP